jgi:hypothetical protein
MLALLESGPDLGQEMYRPNVFKVSFITSKKFRDMTAFQIKPQLHYYTRFKVLYSIIIVIFDNFLNVWHINCLLN